MDKSRGRTRELIAIVVATVLIVAACGILRSTLVQDWWRGWLYEEPENVSILREELELTGKGERIFKASHPMLVSEPSTFNFYCGEHEDDVYLSGCYTQGKIYVYEVAREELKDSNKVTAAHELLHAAWLRMGERERYAVEEMLAEVKATNAEWVEEETKLYYETERLEELYVRAGTKLKELPVELEEHYAKYFKNRQQIVEFYENYQTPFRELQAKGQEIKRELDELQESLKIGRKDYQERVDWLEQEIDEFNQCADTAGCFSSRESFEQERAELASEQASLEALRTELNEQIERNNALINEYKKSQEDLGALNASMNSNMVVHVPYSEISK